MSVKPSGPLSFTDIATEFEAVKPYRLSQFYRGGQYVPDSLVNQNVPKSGPIKFSNMYGATKQFVIVIDSNRENVDVRALFQQIYGDPGGKPVNVLLEINQALTIGGVGDYALKIGQFPAGSQITVNNRASIQGFAGGQNSGVGGSCILGNYPDQTMVFNNAGQVFAGGGGGGVGGTGGKGGDGFYDVRQSLGASGCYDTAGAARVPFCAEDCGAADVCECAFGSGAFCVSDGKISSCILLFCSGCNTCYRNARAYTSGGAGGGGGAGGFGQGYKRSRTNGNNGAGGSAGGTNAGTGGTGGKGGDGGDWGQPGAQGNTGGTGSNGNASAGLAGAAGAGGGAAGNYLVKGGANFTFNNQGQIAGGLA